MKPYKKMISNIASSHLKKTKAEELNRLFSKHSDIGSIDIQNLNILNHFKKEMMFFEATQKCSKVFKRLKNCPDTFPPSSLEEKRCFSAAGVFITKLKSSTSDYLIDLLCFMSSYLYQKNCLIYFMI